MQELPQQLPQPDPPCITGSQPRAPAGPSLDALKRHLRALDADVGAVALDFALHLGYTQLMEAALLLRRPEVLFVAGASDRALPLEPGLTLLGPGYLTEMLAQFTGRQPLLAGKPSALVAEVVAARCPQARLDPRRTLFIGDSLPQDVGQAALSGFTALLVLSGVTSRAEAESAPPELRPHFIAPSLAALVPALRRAAAARALRCSEQ